MLTTARVACWSSAVIFAAIAFGNEAPLSEEEVLAIYNKAQEAQNAGEHEEALAGFLTVKKHRPDDWRTRAKVVQEYSALGRLEARDAEIASLYAFRSELPQEVASEMPYFCREQITAGKRKLMVFEYFVLQGDRAVKYSFVVLDETGKRQDFKITLGSYDTTTQVARQIGSIGKDERLFHLDGYFAGDEHQTYGFFKGEPKYGDVRKMVIEILEKNIAPLSGSKPAAKGAELEINTGDEPAPTKPIDGD